MSMPAERIRSAMDLRQLLEGIADAPPVAINGIGDDSRRLATGDAFLAYQGNTHHGLEFADAAIDSGAAAVVWAYMGAGATNVLVRSALESHAEATGAMGQNMLAWTQNGRLNLNDSLVGGGAPPPPPGGPGVHVGDLDGSASTQGRNWTAQATISVHHETEVLANGMTVNGMWTGGHTGADSCVTNNGQCTVATPAMLKRNSSSATFTVTGITGADYQSAANHDPDADSDGNAITVAR